eukprot:896519-Pelagomonas_calceolata.AAC.4
MHHGHQCFVGWTVDANRHMDPSTFPLQRSQLLLHFSTIHGHSTCALTCVLEELEKAYTIAFPQFLLPAAQAKPSAEKGRASPTPEVPRTVALSGLDTPCHRAGIRAYRASLQQVRRNENQKQNNNVCSQNTLHRFRKSRFLALIRVPVAVSDAMLENSHKKGWMQCSTY